MSYILIIITGVLAIIGATVKTTDDKGVKHFLKLTTGGVVLIIFLAASIVFSLLNQYNDDEKKKDEKIAAQNKAIQDSLKYINDSLALERKFTMDSLGHAKTLSDLQKQRDFDSTQLIRDSLHFLTTIYKFGEQLSTQQKTIAEVNKVLNPLLPMKISFNYQLKDLPKDINDSVRWYCTQIRISQTNNLPEKFHLSFDAQDNSFDVSQGSYSTRQELKTYDSSYLRLSSFMHQFFTSSVDVIFTKEIPNTKFRSTELFIESLSDALIGYSYHSSGTISLSLSGSVLKENLLIDDALSVVELDGDSVEISYRLFNEDLPFKLSKITITVGAYFSKQYELIPVVDLLEPKRYFAKFEVKNARWMLK